ncbi:hypothetical protein LCGC14_1155410 [marine sediment metagenome]|uniref:Uncharacterized protein n=1 Tax=marine sediment metagenome TaxID=412755 RepID=A0A0F9PCF9_9ZZZZ
MKVHFEETDHLVLFPETAQEERDLKALGECAQLRLTGSFYAHRLKGTHMVPAKEKAI